LNLKVEQLSARESIFCALGTRRPLMDADQFPDSSRTALRLPVAPECDRADFANEQGFAGFVHLVDNSAEFVGDESHWTMTEYESWTAAHTSETVRLEFTRIAASDPMFPLKLTPEIVTVAIGHSRGPGTVSAEIEGVQEFKTAKITWKSCKRHEVSNLHRWRWLGVELEEILSYTRFRIQNFGYLRRSHANNADVDCDVLRHDLLERVEMTIPDSKEAHRVVLAHGSVMIEHMSASDYQEFAVVPQKCGGAVVHLCRVLAGWRHAE
jgi:hypothetical protein